MALINKKLTELTEKLSVPDDAYIHIVDTSDTSQSPEGSSYKAKKSTISGTVKAQTGVSGTVKTNSNIVDPIVYLKDEVDTLIVGKQDILGFTAENVANKQNNLDVDITNAKYPTVTAVNNGLSVKADTTALALKADKINTYTKAETDNIIASVEIDVANKENTANKQNSLLVDGTGVKFPTVDAVNNGLDTKQNTLVSGANIKTINGTSILGSGDIAVSGGSDVSSDKAILFSGSSIFYFGDSFTNGYASLFSNANNLTGNILSVSGAGWREAIFKSYVNVASFNNSTFSVVMAGLNDLRNAGNNLKTFEKIKSCARSLIVNNFLKSAIPANSGSITASGTWATTSGITDKASNSLSGLVRVSASSGSTLTYTFTSPNLVIGTFSTDEITTFGGDFSYAIDGGTPITYSGKNKTDGVAIGGHNNSLVPNAIVITGLSTGAHTVVITSLENAPARIDYLGTLLPTELCAPIVISDIPYLNNAGYATAPANATSDIIDLGNTALDDLMNEFKGFPVYGYKINDFYNSISGDNIHPSILGYKQIANGLQTVIQAGNAYSSQNPLILAGTNSNKGYLSNNSDITALGSNFNPITAEIPSSAKASSAIYLGALSSDSFIDFYTTPANNSIPTRRMRLNKDGKLSIGNTNTAYDFDLSGTARVTGQTIIQGGMQVLGGLVSPIGSGGFELEYTGGTAFMTAYNRAGSAFLPLSIRASSILFTNTVTVPKLVTTGVINLKSYTVSTLPAGIQGDTAYVTDATAPTYLGTLIGGGSVKVPVFFNGTAWVSH